MAVRVAQTHAQEHAHRLAIVDAKNQPGQKVLTAPLPVLRALRKLGEDIRDARRRRRIPVVAILAERASISRMTLNRIEKGDPGASLGNYATVLFALGMVDRLADMADPRHDSVGFELDEEHLPQRSRLPRRERRRSDGQTGRCVPLHLVGKVVVLPVVASPPLFGSYLELRELAEASSVRSNV